MQTQFKGMILFLSFMTIFSGCSKLNNEHDSALSTDIGKQQEAMTNVTPAIYKTYEQQAEAIIGYSELYNLAVESQEGKRENGMYVIPGLLSTTTLENNQIKTIVECDSMTPQGVTMAGDYLLISSYCHEHKHNSVFYVLDKNTHQYIKTVVLKGYPHVGGITYDPIAKNVWVCARHKDRAEIVAIPMDSIENYELKNTLQPIKYTQQVELPQVKRASVITYSNKNIYVGYFDSQSDGKLEQYPLDERGKMTGQLASEQVIHTTMDIDKSKTNETIVKELQGITFVEDKLVVTQSYGAFKNSKLLLFNYDTNKKSFLDNDIEKVVDMPAHAEQVSASEGQIYAIFESAAKPYRENEKVWVDRVLRIDTKKLLQE